MSRRLALLIGNTKFDDSEHFPELHTPENDVIDLQTVLLEYGEFDVVDILIDEDAESVRRSIEEFYTRAQRGDLTLLYYSGHGYRGKDGNLSFATRNSRADLLLSTGIGESFVHAAMKHSQSRHRVVILDCCFSGAFASGRKGDDQVLFSEELKGEATAILASSGTIQYSFEEEGRNSLFTSHILRGIRTADADEDRDGRITVEELYGYSERQVRSVRTEQTPVMLLNTRNSELLIAKGAQLSLSKVFISSTSHENHYFVTWLSSKLRLKGYDVWYETREGQQNEDYKARLEDIIGREASIFLFVVSKDSVQKRTSLQQLMYAHSIVGRGAFIIPLQVEEVSLDDLPLEIRDLSQIDFSTNWAEGLQQLTDRLVQGNVPTDQVPDPEAVLEYWKQAQSIDTSLLMREERYRSNWFEFVLPPYIYLYVPEVYATLSGLDNLDVPLVIEGKYLISFASQESLVSRNVLINKAICIDTTQFMAHREYWIKGTRDTIKETNQKIINLLNQAFTLFLIKQGLKQYRLSEDEVFYFPSVTKDVAKANLKKYGRGIVQLSGKAKAFNWHFAIKAQAFLHPVPAYFLTHHVVFTREGVPVSKQKQHSLRRSLGKDWYNKKWRDLVLGATLWLSEDDTRTVLQLPIGSANCMNVNNEPMDFTSSIGYSEPRKGRL